MKITPVLIAAMAGTISYFLAGWLVFEGLIGGFMEARTTKIEGFKRGAEDSSMGLIFLSCAAYALLLAILFQRMNVQTAFEGAIYGPLIGILIAVMTDSYWHATSRFFNNFEPILADIAAAGLTVGLMGAVIGWVLGRF